MLVASKKRWALVHEVTAGETGQAEELPLQHFIDKLEPVDLLLIEGFKQEAFPKLMVLRPDHNAEPLPLDVHNVVAIASDAAIDVRDYKVEGMLLDLNNIDEITNFIENYCGLAVHQ